MDRPISGAEVTRVALVEAAIRLFGERGYDAVSTREIADLAAANIGSIAYHFGGKPGLRRACAEFVIANIRAQIGPSFLRPLPKLCADDALQMIEQTLATFSCIWLTSEQSYHFVNFVLREMMDPGEISEIFYVNWMKPVHMRFCTLFAMATGLDEESEEVKIGVFSFIGQVFHFRLARPFIMRRLEWDEMGERQANRLSTLLVRNARAIVTSYRQIEK
jgi:AcrR family transcriptional regulator